MKMSSSSSTELDTVLNSCRVCLSTENLLRCSRCKSVYYCSKDHQRQDWRRHKQQCCQTGTRCERDYVKTLLNQSAAVLPSEGSSEDEVMSAKAEVLNPNLELFGAGPRSPQGGDGMVQSRFPEVPLRAGFRPFDFVTDEMCRNVIRDMDAYGVCVLDNFMGEEVGRAVLGEVLAMYNTKGIFKDGQLVSSSGGDQRSIRGDRITWIDGRERYCRHIGLLISQVDSLIMRANRMLNNGKLGSYNINGRTKVSVYKHADFTSRFRAFRFPSCYLLLADSMPRVTYAVFAHDAVAVALFFWGAGRAGG